MRIVVLLFLTLIIRHRPLTENTFGRKLIRDNAIQMDPSAHLPWTFLSNFHALRLP